jgi:hypothetical protein
MQQMADTMADMHVDAAGMPRDAPRARGDVPGAKGATAASTIATTTTSSTPGQAPEVHECDTPGVSFVLHREIYPNLGRSVKFSISRSRLSPFIKLLVNVSLISDFTWSPEGQIWSLLKFLFLGTNANSKIILEL